METNDRGAPSSCQQGFTLTEVCFALAIMTLAFSSILSVQSGSISATSRAKQMNIVGMLAKNQMVETEYKIQGKRFIEIPKEESGKFEKPYEDYRWKVQVKEVNFPNFAGMAAASGGDGKDNRSTGGTSNLGGAVGPEQVSQQISKFFSQALREVTVTVYWNQGTKEQSFSISTFWVDLNHEFNPLQ